MNVKPRCGTGWASLIEPLIARCQTEGVEILQIKEKLGQLSFCIGAASPELQETIRHAERASEKMCELCGAPGSPRVKNAWVRTRCDTHEHTPARAFLATDK